MHLLDNHTKNGFTLVETAISIVILSIVVIGSFQYITVSRAKISDAAHTLKAWQEISNRFEYAYAIGYSSLIDSLPETATLLEWDERKSYRTTTVAAIDDELDGLAPADSTLPDYLKITVKVSRFRPDNVTDSSFIYFSPQRSLK